MGHCVSIKQDLVTVGYAFKSNPNTGNVRHGTPIKLCRHGVHCTVDNKGTYYHSVEEPGVDDMLCPSHADYRGQEVGWISKYYAANWYETPLYQTDEHHINCDPIPHYEISDTGSIVSDELLGYSVKQSACVTIDGAMSMPFFETFGGNLSIEAALLMYFMISVFSLLIALAVFIKKCVLKRISCKKKVKYAKVIAVDENEDEMDL